LTIPLLPPSHKDTSIRHPSFLLVFSLFPFRKTSHYTSTRLPLLPFLTLNVFPSLTKMSSTVLSLAFPGSRHPYLAFGDREEVFGGQLTSLINGFEHESRPMSDLLEDLSQGKTKDQIVNIIYFKYRC
jgi:hypothetical protein